MTSGTAAEQDPAAASDPSDAAALSAHPGEPPSTGRPGASRRRHSWMWLVTIAIVLVVLVRAFVAQSFYVPSGSMEPTIRPGDRVLVDRLVSGADLKRGDIVVFDGTTTFAVADRTPHRASGIIGRMLGGLASAVGVNLGEQDFIKRIVGLPGDRVVCCDNNGRIIVNGTAVQEPYVMPGDKPSETTFDVVVPPGRLWVMGDHRSDSADSRSHLGDPGGGTVALDAVVGKATFTYWPLTRFGGFSSPSALAAVPRAAHR